MTSSVYQPKLRMNVSNLLNFEPPPTHVSRELAVRPLKFIYCSGTVYFVKMSLVSTLRVLQRTTQYCILNNATRQMSSGNQKLTNLEVNNKTGIATLTMNRPPVNSLNLELLSEIADALDILETDRAKGLILTSGSNTVFSAGLDIMEMYKPNEERMRKFWDTLQGAWLKLYGSTFPTAAAINGHSPAGGCLLALSCEYRVMCPNFTIGLNETRLGIVAPKWFQASMANVLPKRQTEMALTLGTMFSTDEALKIGLVDELASDKADAIQKCEKYLLQFQKVNSLARSMTKRVLRGPELQDLEDNRDADLEQFVFFAKQPKVQQSLEVYLANLKKKQ